MKIRLLCSALLLGVFASQSAGAELVKEYGAGNRYERFTELHPQIKGLNAAETKQFQDKLLRLSDMFAGMSWVSNPPNGLCARLSVSPGKQARKSYDANRAMATGSVGVLQPAGFNGQNCTDLTNNGVSLSFNFFEGIFDTGDEVRLGSETFYARPAIERQSGGVTVFKDGSILVHRPGDSVFVPVSKERYLEALAAEFQDSLGETESISAGGGEYERWLREEKPLLIAENEAQIKELAAYMSKEDLAKMRQALAESIEMAGEAVKAMDTEMSGMQGEVDQALATQSGELAQIRANLAALSPAERKLPACINDDPFSAGPNECRDGTMVVEFNRSFFDDAASSGDLRLIRISPGIGALGRYRAESQQAFEQRIGIYREIDLNLLQSMID